MDRHTYLNKNILFIKKNIKDDLILVYVFGFHK